MELENAFFNAFKFVLLNSKRSSVWNKKQTSPPSFRKTMAGVLVINWHKGLKVSPFLLLKSKQWKTTILLHKNCLRVQLRNILERKKKLRKFLFHFTEGEQKNIWVSFECILGHYSRFSYANFYYFSTKSWATKVATSVAWMIIFFIYRTIEWYFSFNDEFLFCNLWPRKWKFEQLNRTQPTSKYKTEAAFGLIK